MNGSEVLPYGNRSGILALLNNLLNVGSRKLLLWLTLIELFNVVHVNLLYNLLTLEQIVHSVEVFTSHNRSGIFAYILWPGL